MNVVALVFEFRQGNHSICFGTTDLNRRKCLAFCKAECWVHPVEYLSEHTNGDRTEKNEHDRRMHLQSECAGGDSITTKEGDEGDL
jgi:hypothetical protein